MARRGALYLMPSMAVLAMAALVLGPGRQRPSIGARVWGVPADGARLLALRVETVERQFGSDETVPVEPLTVTLSQAGKPLASWTGKSADDGVAEALFHLEQPLSGTVEARVSSGKALLAEAPIALRAIAPPVLDHTVVDGKTTGPLRVHLEIERGVLAAPFEGALHVLVVGPDGSAVPSLDLDPVLQGADEGPRAVQGVLRTDETGAGAIKVLPNSHAIDLHLAMAVTFPRRNADLDSTWDGGVPVHPGALWLDPATLEKSILGVASPVPRARAYASVLGKEGRIFGAVVALAADGKGFSRGALEMPPDLRAAAVALTLSGDAQERGSGTVTWPLQGTLGVERASRLEPLLDGMALTERLEQKRARTARLVSVLVAFVAAAFEAVLLVLYSRASQQKLAAHLAALSEDEGDRAAAARMTAAPASRAFTLVVMVGLVVLGFGAMAAFALVH